MLALFSYSLLANGKGLGQECLQSQQKAVPMFYVLDMMLYRKSTLDSFVFHLLPQKCAKIHTKFQRIVCLSLLWLYLL